MATELSYIFWALGVETETPWVIPEPAGVLSENDVADIHREVSAAVPPNPDLAEAAVTLFIQMPTPVSVTNVPPVVGTLGQLRTTAPNGPKEIFCTRVNLESETVRTMLPSCAPRKLGDLHTMVLTDCQATPSAAVLPNRTLAQGSGGPEKAPSMVIEKAPVAGPFVGIVEDIPCELTMAGKPKSNTTTATSKHQRRFFWTARWDNVFAPARGMARGTRSSDFDHFILVV